MCKDSKMPLLFGWGCRRCRGRPGCLEIGNLLVQQRNVGLDAQEFFTQDAPVVLIGQMPNGDPFRVSHPLVKRSAWLAWKLGLFQLPCIDSIEDTLATIPEQREDNKPWDKSTT